jgi:hypothetical protein
MNLNQKVAEAKPHFFAILTFFAVAFIYFSPNFKDKTHRQEDVTQGLIKATELTRYTDENGDFPAWTNSIFSGMPSTMILGKPIQNILVKVYAALPLSWGKYPFKILLLSFIGFYILMCCMGVKPMMGTLASLVYGFATYSISSIEAAHYTKVLAMALLPAVLGGFHLLFRGRYLWGLITMSFCFGLQNYFFNYQITYYTLI